MEYTDIIMMDAGAKIKVIGVGGGGGNAVNNMVAGALSGVHFIAANTDLQALSKSRAEHTIQLGDKLTRGLGAGGDPEKGYQSALESIEQIKELIGDADMVFVTAGMGGGTGTGAAPVIAQAAKELGALTVGVVTKPFFFEGKRRLEAAEAGIAEFRQHVDSLITIPNDRLIQLAPKKALFADMLKRADDVLYSAVKGISDLIKGVGLINLDFADVQAAMGEAGLAMMGEGEASGEGRASQAAMNAINSPLLEDVSISGARGVLMNLAASPDSLTIDEVSEAAGIIQKEVHEDARIYFGALFDESLGDKMRITIIATGINTASHVPMTNKAGNLLQFRQGMSRAATAAAAPAPQAMPGRDTLRQTPGERMYGGERPLPEYLHKPGAGTAVPAVSARSAAPVHAPGGDAFIYDEEELEIPAFMRHLAN